jgi:hypothetical protein
MRVLDVRRERVLAGQLPGRLVARGDESERAVHREAARRPVLSVGGRGLHRTGLPGRKV